MRELYYSALDLAAIANSLDMGAKDEAEFIEKIWIYERAFLLPENYENKRKLILDVSYWRHYLQDKDSIDAEFPAICKDFNSFGSTVEQEQLICVNTDLDLYFKSVRLRILLSSARNYTRIKLRTLLKKYGYQRRSPKLLQHIHNCLLFYHIQPYLRGGLECEIGDISIDETITFRVF